MRSNIQFLQMDPCALQPSLGSFDCVLMTNVLEYIASPSAPLQRMGGARGVVKPGGFLVVACTGDWSEEYSGKQLWLEGRMGENGQKVSLVIPFLGYCFKFDHHCVVLGVKIYASAGNKIHNRPAQNLLDVSEWQSRKLKLLCCA